MLELHHAVPARGAVLVAMNVRLAVEEMVYILEHSGARVCFAISVTVSRKKRKSRLHASFLRSVKNQMKVLKLSWNSEREASTSLDDPSVETSSIRRLTVFTLPSRTRRACSLYA